MYQHIRIETGFHATDAGDWRDYMRGGDFKCSASRLCDNKTPFLIDASGALIGQVMIFGLNHRSATDRDGLEFRRTAQHIAQDGKDYYALKYTRAPVEFTQFSRTELLSADSLSLFRLTDPYTVKHLHENSWFIGLIPGHLLESRLKVSNTLGLRTRSAAEGVGRLLRHFCVEVVELMRHTSTQEVASALADQLASLTALAFNASDEGSDRAQGNLRHLRYQGILKCIDDNLHYGDLTPQWVAECLDISRSYLSQLLAGHGTSFVEQLRKRRLARAASDLANPAFSMLTVTEIAYRCGFNSASHFSRCFIGQFGLSPRDWRNQRLATLGLAP